MLEREEEEARSLIFCPLVEMTPCRHRILRYVDVAERRICEIPGPAQSLTSKSPYYPEYQVNEGWWEGHHLLQGLEAHLLFLILEERLCNPLGKASSLLQSVISSLVSFAQGNPPSGKDTRFPHLIIRMSRSWRRLCKPLALNNEKHKGT
ncbi:hypothetical protein CUMW_133510 [Citrus unshiu]|nr:hypothetical protein CUMW_133510 [Citrus unshiu]